MKQPLIFPINPQTSRWHLFKSIALLGALVLIFFPFLRRGLVGLNPSITVMPIIAIALGFIVIRSSYDRQHDSTLRISPDTISTDIYRKSVAFAIHDIIHVRLLSKGGVVSGGLLSTEDDAISFGNFETPEQIWDAIKDNVSADTIIETTTNSASVQRDNQWLLRVQNAFYIALGVLVLWRGYDAINTHLLGCILLSVPVGALAHNWNRFIPDTTTRWKARLKSLSWTLLLIPSAYLYADSSWPVSLVPSHPCSWFNLAETNCLSVQESVHDPISFISNDTFLLEHRSVAQSRTLAPFGRFQHRTIISGWQQEANGPIISSPDQTYVVVDDYDNASIYDATSRQRIAQFPGDQFSGDAQFSADSSIIGFWERGRENIALFNSADGSPYRTIATEADSFAFSPADTVLALVTEQAVVLSDYKSDAIQATIPFPNTSALAFSSDGKQVALTDRETIAVFSAETGTLLTTITIDPTLKRPSIKLAFSPTQPVLYAAIKHDTVDWETNHGEQLHLVSWSLPDGVQQRYELVDRANNLSLRQLTLSPDGSLAAIVTFRGLFLFEGDTVFPAP